MESKLWIIDDAADTKKFTKVEVKLKVLTNEDIGFDQPNVKRYDDANV